jgi:hypothetical protein
MGLAAELGTQVAAAFYFFGLLFRQALAVCGCAALVFLAACLLEA